MQYNKIKEFIIHLEENFDINTWKMGEIHVWPSLRMRLFFYLRKITILGDRQEVNSNFLKFIKKLISFIKYRLEEVTGLLLHSFWINKLPQKKHIFVGADAHRVDYKKCRFNRFFDVIINEQKLEDKYLYLEYGRDPHKKLYRSERVYRYPVMLKGYLLYRRLFGKREKPTLDFSGYENLLGYMQSNKLLEPFASQISIHKVELWAQDFCEKVQFFKKVLKKIKPQQIHILCYYNDDIMALTTAANQLNIQTIEMQHGPQAEDHLAYGNWSRIPKEGYDMLPRVYWCWDQHAKDTLHHWVVRNELYKIEITGHPWVRYWKEKENTYPYRDYILYSLQPGLTMEQLFPESIVEFIKHEPYKWFIRVHPRQLSDFVNIKNFLRDRDVLDLVNLDEATNDPLPQIQCNAKLHITHSSGATLEAAEFGLKTILINEIGKHYYYALIKENKAIYIDYTDNNFYKLIKEQAQNT